ncbi:hypothetical protein FDG2_4071 [Candidatus Protofrankia californiensis]|uniref:Glycosyltransferase n=1 Tax=Candidatus Protofrankia californiensis TaxID=1839754 RepID=A0A1C3P374_9ACTN|nr:hypothetical protein FDG2_4071 [Candidatus Protofrankia californiensis]
MRIGYSFWGFLGPGITDTPDGGRSHRRPLIEGLLSRGHEVVFLQRDRDLREAGDDLRNHYIWDNGLPAIDVLFLEWRWPLPGRNTTPCGSPGHTCDLHRQDELLAHYTAWRKIPTIVWDKDLQMAATSPLRSLPNVATCEAALRPSPGAESLLFPITDTALDNADPAALAALPRRLPLVYVGNQYDRDEAFSEFFARAAAHVPHRVAGKWTRTAHWPHVNFTGRCAFPEVWELHESALATVLLLPDRYARAGQMTQRLFESVLAGCLPITPAALPYAAAFTPSALHAATGDAVVGRICELQSIAGTARHAALIAECVGMLGTFRLSHQLVTIDRVLERLTDDSSAYPSPRLPAARH